MERNYCLRCREEIPTESGHLCRECGEELAGEERPVMSNPRVRGFVLGVASGVCATVLVAAVLVEQGRRKQQAAWDEEVAAWERHAEQAYDRGVAAGRMAAVQTAECR